MEASQDSANGRVRKALAESAALVGGLAASADDIVRIAEAVASALRSGRRVYLMGNGGSAAQCQHIAAELVGRFKLERRGLPAVALTTDSSILTAVGNDYGFEQVFSRQVEALVEAGDVVIGISSSGRSRNVVEAASVARRKKALVIGFTGASREGLGELADLSVQVTSKDTARIQEAHITALHIVSELVELALAESES